MRREGTMGILAADLPTPLVMVLTELVQNALEHAFEPGRGGEVFLRAERSAGSLEVIVSDDGCGLPPDFRSLDQSGWVCRLSELLSGPRCADHWT